MNEPGDHRGLVPRSALPVAVKDAATALGEEAKMLAAAGARKTISDYVAVIFVTNHSRFTPIFGTLRVWLPNGPVDIHASNVSIDPPSIFVMGPGGNTFLDEFWGNARKKFEWVTLKVLN